MKRCVLLVILACIAATGCAQKRLTPQEIEAERERQIKMVTRVYDGKTPKDVLLAADNLFRLDDHDYQLAHSENSLQAQRNWFIYVILAAASGVDTWIIQATPVDGGTKVVAQCATQGQNIMPMGTMGVNGQMGATAATTPVMAGMSTSQALYDLFYSRLDYLLGKSKVWVSCRDANKLYPGNNDQLCTCADDSPPDGTPRKESGGTSKQDN